MADALYPKGLEGILGDSIELSTDDIVVHGVDTASYTYSASHEFVSDLGGSSIVCTSDPLSTKTFTDGVFDAADIIITSVMGNTFEAWVIAQDTGVAATSRLIAYIDSDTALPITPTGGDIQIGWSGSGIFDITAC